MKILNPDFERDLSAGKSVRLDLGCGKNIRKNCYGIDLVEIEGIDALADFNKPLQFLPNNCCEYIHSSHVLEHVHEFLLHMQEIYRISKPGCRIEIIVPHFSNVFGYSDPTHVRFFGILSMNYFVAREDQPNSKKVPTFYSDIRFKIHSVDIEFYRLSKIDRMISPLFSKFVNHSPGTQTFFERRLANLYHAWQLRFIMEPLKPEL